MLNNNAHRSLLSLSRRARTPRLRSRLEWSEQELVIPEGKYKDQKFRVSRQPWTRHVLDNMGKWRRNLLTGPKQAGKTLLGFVDPILYHLFEVGEKVGCGVPNLDMVADKWNEDILPAIEASRYRDLLPRTGRGSKGGTPIRIDFLNGAALRFFGAGGGDKQRAGFTTRILVVTETDGFDEVGGTSRESTKLSQLEGRTLADPENALIYYECTVSTEDGFTWQQYHNGTASRIVCQCRHCLHWVTPGRSDLVGWQDAENEIQAGRSASFACPDCGGLWTEADRVQMNQSSLMVHSGQEITDDGCIVGQPIETNLFSFHFNAFNNMFQPTWFLGEREWLASRADNHDEAEIAILQESWALPTKNETVEKVEISAGIVRGSASGYAGRCSGLARGVIPEGTESVTAFIDVSKRILQWEAVAWLPNRSHTVDYGFFETDRPDVVGDETAIRDALSTLRDDLERRFDLTIGLVDCGFWRDVILAWLATNHRGIWRPSHGMSSYVHPTKPTADKRPSKSGARWHFAKDGPHWVVNFDPDSFKHVVHGSFIVRPLREDGSNAPGSITLFGENPQEHTEYAMQVTAEQWTTKFSKDKPTKRADSRAWVKIRKANHQLDCHVGNTVARSVALDLAPSLKGPIKLSEIQRNR